MVRGEERGKEVEAGGERNGSQIRWGMRKIGVFLSGYCHNFFL